MCQSIFIFLAGATNHDDKLAARFVLLEMGQHVGQRAPYYILMHFRDLSTDGYGSVRSESLDELLQSFHNTVWRLVEHHRACFLG